MSDSSPADLKKDSDRPKRRRRTPESARRAILDAAGQRLTRDGPDGLRLQSIAGDLGIAHSSILHHFGSREGLLEALAADAFEALERDLAVALEQSANDASRASHLLERVARTMRGQGHARLLAWQILSGRLPRDPSADAEDVSDQMLSRIAEVVHRTRAEHARQTGIDVPELEDSRYFVLWMAYSLLGEALAGDVFVASLGLPPSEAEHRGFIDWLANRSRALLLPKGANPLEESE